ncbi:MAG: 4Fe-4S binding protein, partial [Pseudomonadota bacterium]|nr:4Fe-4S binding protein [Pseudomonadota bacterium]
MKINGKNIHICDCEGTIPLDKKTVSKFFSEPNVKINTHLCRSQIDNFTSAVSEGDPMVVCCTQEAPLFIETAEKTRPETEITYTNIRERAGWSSEGQQSLPKIKALLTEATLDAPLAGSVTMLSEGAVIVYGENESTLEIAKQLSKRLDVTCVINNIDNTSPPRLIDFPIFVGKVSKIEGRLGEFILTVDNYSPIQVSSRETLLSGHNSSDNVSLKTDLVLNLSADKKILTGAEKRDGYFCPDIEDSVGTQKALFEITDLIGEFEKPRYINYNPEICVHSRSNQVGCNRCLDVCPTGAIAENQDEIVIDPYVCAGCGSCSSVCPTGAAKYELPAGNFIYERLKLLLNTFIEAGGKCPSLLVHDTSYGEEMISVLAKHGKGLPANVLPFALNEVTQIGFDFMCVALGYGVDRIFVLGSPTKQEEMDGLYSQLELSEAITTSLGYGTGRVKIITDPDPDALSDTLFEKWETVNIVPGDYITLGGKREIVNLALRHLHDNAPSQIDLVELPDGAPFGAIEVNTDGCTLCLSCVSACPTGALRDNPDAPQFTFTETSCVQCGLCKTICPESVISLKPRYNFSVEGRSAKVVKEETPFDCVKCGKPFGVKSSIDKMVEQLSGHSMFSEGQAIERIKMCPDCRVIDMFDEPNTPMAGAPRPKIRTTDDYLIEREQLRQDADEFIKEKGLNKTDDNG